MSILTPGVTLPFATVQARHLQRGDLIGGTSGEWVTVASVYVDPNVRDLVADVEVTPLTHPDRPRMWQIDAAARMAILRPDGSDR